MLSPDEVYGVLNTVMDPEVPVISVVELGIVRDVAIQNDAVTITITPTYSGCPAMREIEADIRTALLERGVRDVNVKLVLSPAWTTDWIGPEARAASKRSTSSAVSLRPDSTIRRPGRSPFLVQINTACAAKARSGTPPKRSNRIKPVSSTLRTMNPS